MPPLWYTTPPAPSTTWPTMLDRLSRRSGGARARPPWPVDERDHADAHVEHLIALLRVDVAGVAQELEQAPERANSKRSMTASLEPSTRGRLSTKPPPVMCAIAAILRRLRAAARAACSRSGAQRATLPPRSRRPVPSGDRRPTGPCGRTGSCARANNRWCAGPRTTARARPAPALRGCRRAASPRRRCRR